MRRRGEAAVFRRSRLRVLSLSARVLCLSDGLVLLFEPRTLRPDPNTDSPRSHTRAFNSYFTLTCAFIKLVHIYFVRFRCARRYRSVRHRRSESRRRWIFFPPRFRTSVHLSAVGGTELPARHRTIRLSLGCCPGTEHPGLFVWSRDGPVLPPDPTRADRSGAALRSGGVRGKVFLRARFSLFLTSRSCSVGASKNKKKKPRI